MTAVTGVSNKAKDILNKLERQTTQSYDFRINNYSAGVGHSFLPIRFKKQKKIFFCSQNALGYS
jgi:hypothetical protein